MQMSVQMTFVDKLKVRKIIFFFGNFKWVGLIPGSTQFRIEQRLKNTIYKDSGLDYVALIAQAEMAEN